MEKNRLLEIKRQLEFLKEQCKPSDIWKDHLEFNKDYGNLYTKEGIEAVSNVLNEFIDKLKKLDNYLKTDEILNIVINLIINLNKISHKYLNMIETDEREELCEFIFHALDLIEFEYSGDITEKYREW